MQRKSMDWFLYDKDLRRRRVNSPTKLTGKYFYKTSFEAAIKNIQSLTQFQYSNIDITLAFLP